MSIEHFGNWGNGEQTVKVNLKLTFVVVKTKKLKITFLIAKPGASLNAAYNSSLMDRGFADETVRFPQLPCLAFDIKVTVRSAKPPLCVVDGGKL